MKDMGNITPRLHIPSADSHENDPALLIIKYIILPINMRPNPIVIAPLLFLVRF